MSTKTAERKQRCRRDERQTEEPKDATRFANPWTYSGVQYRGSSVLESTLLPSASIIENYTDGCYVRKCDKSVYKFGLNRMSTAAAAAHSSMADVQ